MIDKERKDAKTGKRFGNDKYGIDLMFSKAEHPRGPQDIIEACRACLTEHGITGAAQGPHLVARIKDGDKQLAKIAPEKQANYAALKGMWIIRANTKDDLVAEARVANARAQPVDARATSMIFSGTYGRAALSITFMADLKEPGLVFYLQGYQFTRTGAKLPFGEPGGGKRTAAQMFGGTSGGVSDQAPADLDNEDPF